MKSLSPWMDNLNFDWQPVINEAEIKSYNRNIHIYHQVDTASHLFIVLEGRVRLYTITEDGKEKAIKIAGKNCIIGEYQSPSDKYYLENAVTTSKVRLAKISFCKFTSIIFSNKELLKQFLELQNIKYSLAIKDNLQLSYDSTSARICDALYHLAKDYGKKKSTGVTIIMEFTHQELANLVGTSRVTVAKTIGELINKEIIVKIDKYYHIVELEKLLNHNY